MFAYDSLFFRCDIISLLCFCCCLLSVQLLLFGGITRKTFISNAHQIAIEPKIKWFPSPSCFLLLVSEKSLMFFVEKKIDFPSFFFYLISALFLFGELRKGCSTNEVAERKAECTAHSITTYAECGWARKRFFYLFNFSFSTLAHFTFISDRAFSCYDSILRQKGCLQCVFEIDLD